MRISRHPARREAGLVRFQDDRSAKNAPMQHAGTIDWGALIGKGIRDYGTKRTLMTYAVRGGEGDIMTALAARGADSAGASRAPTLLAVETAGSQENVRVWSPDPWRHWLRAACWVVFLGPGAAFLLWALHWRFMAPPCLLMSGIALYFAFRRACTITTDENGIAMLTRCGTRALRWEEIRGASYVHGTMLGILPLVYPYIELLLDLHSDCVVELNLSGHSVQVQRKLFSLIARKARLAPPPYFVPYPQLVQQPRSAEQTTATLRPANDSELNLLNEPAPPVSR